MKYLNQFMYLAVVLVNTQEVLVASVELQNLGILPVAVAAIQLHYMRLVLVVK